VIPDVRAVVWKERKAVMRQPGSRTRVLLTIGAPIGVFALYWPLSEGPDWVREIDSLFIAVFVPMIVAMITTPDSFAGERERRTLSTLLASRLSDRAILLGKVAFNVALAWGFALVTLLISLVVVNVANSDEGLLMFTPLLLTANLLISFLVAVLAVSLGVIISLRSETVQQAQQTLTAVLFAVPLVLGPIVFLVASKWPEWGPKELLSGVDPAVVLLGATLALLAIDVALLALGMVRFRRDKLITTR
jgi:ABC-2 type transport system permease protein